MGKQTGYLLIAVLLLIEVPRFFGAYDGLDPNLFGLPLTAFGTGIALPFGSMYIFHTWWKTKRKNRGWLLAWFSVNLALSGSILVPWGMARLRGVPLPEVVTGWWDWAWVAVVMLSPFVLMGGITTAIAFQKEERKRTDEPEEPADGPRTQAGFPGLDEMDRAIVDAWRGAPRLSYLEVGRRAGASKSTIGRRATALVERGVLERTGEGMVVRGDNHR